MYLILSDGSEWTEVPETMIHEASIDCLIMWRLKCHTWGIARAGFGNASDGATASGSVQNILYISQPFARVAFAIVRKNGLVSFASASIWTFRCYSLLNLLSVRTMESDNSLL